MFSAPGYFFSSAIAPLALASTSRATPRPHSALLSLPHTIPQHTYQHTTHTHTRAHAHTHNPLTIPILTLGIRILTHPLLTAFQICFSWPHKVLINCCSKLSVCVTYTCKLIHDYLCTHQHTHAHRSMGYNSLLDSKLSGENPTANRWRMLTCGSNWHSGATGASTSVSSICHNVQWNAMHV